MFSRPFNRQPMALDLLDTPLRISWDLHQNDQPMPAPLVELVLQRLADAGVFFVTLQRQPLLHPQIGQILHHLAGSGCQALVVCQGTPAELAALDVALPLPNLLLDIAPWTAGGKLLPTPLTAAVAQVRSQGFEPGLLLVPNSENICLIPEVFELCRELGIGRFKLPNTPHDGSLTHASALPGPADLERLAAVLRGQPLKASSAVSLEIHDLFLWELLVPALGGERGEYGGCQAANSIGHIDGEGRLHPCSSWPQVLGSLAGQSIEDLWASSLRQQIRAEIAACPRGCRGCGDYPLCFGGCRGLARSLNASAGGRDLLCRGPRPPRR